MIGLYEAYAMVVNLLARPFLGIRTNHLGLRVRTLAEVLVCDQTVNELAGMTALKSG